MGKRTKQKIFTLVQSGSLMKLKHYLEVQTKKNKKFDIDVKSGDQGRTSLHIACLLGDDAVVRCLLFYGAHGGARDKNNDTPLHLAARFVADNSDDRKLLMEPLIRKFPEVVDSLNDENESPGSLLKEAKQRHRVLKQLSKQPEETGSQFVDQELSEEKPRSSDWEEKLSAAWENDLADLGVAREHAIEDKRWEVPELPTFGEWADRIAEEYKRKHWTEWERSKRRKETNKRRKREEVRDLIDRSEREEEKYRRKLAEKKRETLESKQREYKRKMELHVSEKPAEKLRFKNIPWPCRGPVTEMVDVIMFGQPEQASDRRKFILKQQILWHPDKFRQRCHDLLHDDDREVILDTVNLLSQSLNALLSEC